MKHRSEILSWDILSTKAYWDRDVSLSNWKEYAHKAHRSFLPGAVKVFDPVEFIHYYGVEEFKVDWPRLRKSLDADTAKRHAPVFDLAWSRLISGSWNLAPDERIASMPPRKREFLFTVARKPGLSIYAIASMLDMQYRRAYDHAKDLIKTGILLVKPSVQSGRVSNLLYPRSAVASCADQQFRTQRQEPSPQSQRLNALPKEH